MGSDIDPVAVKSTKLNLERAGMNIPVKQMNAHEILPPQEKSLFICNPPYGDRLMPDDEEKLKELYKELGENWKRNWKGHRAGVLTGNLPMLKSISLRTSKKIIIFNGDIECRVAEYQLF
jgi:putative N6-adenine-specific DNA methylase